MELFKNIFLNSEKIENENITYPNFDLIAMVTVASCLLVGLTSIQLLVS